MGYRPLDDQAALSPGASAYVLNSSFSISDTPVTRSYDWALAYVDVVYVLDVLVLITDSASARTGSPDGYNRTLLTINGQMPGPLVEANEGDTLICELNSTLSSRIVITLSDCCRDLCSQYHKQLDKRDHIDCECLNVPMSSFPSLKCRSSALAWHVPEWHRFHGWCSSKPHAFSSAFNSLPTSVSPQGVSSVSHS